MLTFIIVLMVFLMTLSVLLVLTTYRESDRLKSEMEYLNQQKESVTGIYLDFLDLKTKVTYSLLDPKSANEYNFEEKKENIYEQLKVAIEALPRDKAKLNEIKMTLDGFFKNYDQVARVRDMQKTSRDSLELSLKQISALITESSEPDISRGFQRLLEAQNVYLSNPTSTNFANWQFARNNLRRFSIRNAALLLRIAEYTVKLEREWTNQNEVNRVFEFFNNATTKLDKNLSELANQIRMEYANKARDNASVRSNEQRNQLLFILVAFVFSNSALFYIMWTISQPINRLLTLVKEVENGNYEVRFEYQSSNELATLGYAFNSMLSTIIRDRETIHRHQMELEDKVAERTAELAKAKDTAEAASQAKSDFLAKMSHEIRTPMNGIIGTTEILMNSGMNEQQKEIVKIIQNSGSALLHIISDILDFSKIEAGKLEIYERTFSLRKLIRTVILHFSLEADNKGLSLGYIIDKNIPDIYRGDDGKLRQVLNNLLNNSIKFTHHGKVNLMVSHAAMNSEVVELIFEIGDTGIGISPAKLESVFDSFSQGDNTTTREFGGTGLGTTISRKLVEMMGGKIRAISPNPYLEATSEYPGSVFRFELPLKLCNQYCVELADGSSIRLSDTNFISMSQSMQFGNELSNLERINGITFIRRSETEEVTKVLETIAPRGAIILLDSNILSDEMKPFFQDLIAKYNTCILGMYPEDVRINNWHEYGVEYSLSLPPDQYKFLDTLEEMIKKCFDKHRNMMDTEFLDLMEKRKMTKVLLVEDNLINQKVARKILETMNLQVFIANNGQEALEMVVNENYDIVFMDIQMPVMNGYDSTIAMREKGIAIPIIAMTANALKADKDESLRCGMNDFISKPITFNALSNIMQTWLYATQEKEIIIEPIIQETPMQYRIIDEEEAINRVYDIDLLKELLVDFNKMKELNARVFEDALNTNDVVEVEHLSHALKGVAGNLALEGIYKTSTALNDAAKFGQNERMRELYNLMKSEIERFRAWLPSYIQG